jgi:predicted DNA-binding transcriptional regulator AlpA
MPPTTDPSAFLRTPHAAKYLGLSPRTLEKHRTYGTGPQYRKIGGRVIYQLADLRSWADLGVRRSTTETPQHVVHPARRRTQAAPEQRA